MPASKLFVVGATYAFFTQARIGCRMPAGKAASTHEEHPYTQQKHAN